MLNWFKSFFEEENGKASIKRLWGTGVITVFLISYLKVSITKSELADIPEMWALLIAGLVLGLGAISKMGKRDEKTSE